MNAKEKAWLRKWFWKREAELIKVIPDLKFIEGSDATLQDFVMLNKDSFEIRPAVCVHKNRLVSFGEFVDLCKLKYGEITPDLKLLKPGNKLEFNRVFNGNKKLKIGDFAKELFFKKDGEVDFKKTEFIPWVKKGKEIVFFSEFFGKLLKGCEEK